MTRYIDGFVLPIPTDRLSEYQSLAQSAAKIWMDCGALEYWECAGDDLASECSRSFEEVADAKPDETVIFAWAIFPSREARDAANEKIAADPRMEELMAVLTDAEKPLLSFARMAHGGFRELASASSRG